MTTNSTTEELEARVGKLEREVHALIELAGRNADQGRRFVDDLAAIDATEAAGELTLDPAQG